MPGENGPSDPVGQFWAAHAAYKQAVEAYLALANGAKPAWWRYPARVEWAVSVEKLKRSARHRYREMLDAHQAVVRAASQLRTPVSAQDIEKTRVALSDSMVRSVVRELRDGS
jgi:hypothetical protein